MYNPMMNPNAGQERLNEMLKEAEEYRRAHKVGKPQNVAARLRALIVKTFSLTIR